MWSAPEESHRGSIKLLIFPGVISKKNDGKGAGELRKKSQKTDGEHLKKSPPKGVRQTRELWGRRGADHPC